MYRNKYDVVTSLGVIHHLSDPVKGLVNDAKKRVNHRRFAFCMSIFPDADALDFWLFPGDGEAMGSGLFRLSENTG